jgi:hypothetical protein
MNPNPKTARLLWRVLAILGLLALPITAAITRESPSIAQEVTVDPGTLTAVWATVTAQAVLVTPLPGQVINPEQTLEPTVPPTMTPSMTPTPTIPEDAQLLVRARADLELLAESQMPGARPEGWSGMADPLNPELGLLARLDLELLYGSLVDVDVRPADWIGAVGSTPIAMARDVRHDLELMADLFFGPVERPAGWYGGDPLFRCNRATQVLVQLLQRGGLFSVGDISANDPDFCHQVEIAATRYTEMEILANAERGIFSPEIALVSENTITSDFAVAWLDSSARIRVGVVPNKVPVKVVGRSYADFSNMMLVSGPDFQVFVEYTNTTVTADEFRALPNVATLDVAPVCHAEWCETAD